MGNDDAAPARNGMNDAQRTIAATMDLMSGLVDGRTLDWDDVGARLDALARTAPHDPYSASYLGMARSIVGAGRSFGQGPGGVEDAREMLAGLFAAVPGTGGAAAEAQEWLSRVGGESRATDEQLRALVARAEGDDDATGRAPMRHGAVAAAALWGDRETDPARVDLAVEHAEAAVACTGPRDGERVLYLSMLAGALVRRFEVRTRTADLREARARLEEARDLAGGPGHPHWPAVNEALSEVRRALGDHGDGGGGGAHRAALEGLRGRVWQALAQDDPGGLRGAVREAGADAVRVARTCLTGDDPRGAVTALDLGRGLALFAATAPGAVADLLDATGPADLARRWRAAVATDDSGEPGAHLRREVLASLTDADGGASLLDPPSAEDIGRALQTVDADALAYLVPGDGPTTGYAVVVSAAGRAGYLALPNLTLAHYPGIEDYLRSVSERDTVVDEFSGVLHDVGRWAWRAVMGRLVESYLPGLPEPRSGRVRRLVLVPMGDLARIPWQAAADEHGRYAVESVAISRAASARMLCRDAARPPAAPTPGGLVVGDPGADLPAARGEAYAIREVFYRGARYLGLRPNGSPSRSGAGTADQVAAWLASGDPADGAVAHLACHAYVDATDTEPAAYLALADEGRLHAEELVALPARRPGRAIELVVLSACRTGGSMHGHDEAYSLGTALLAVGVRSVLCTQWEIPDAPQPAFMFMIHHFHRAEGLPVWAAVRAAQLWALDPDRAIPASMPAPLHRSARSPALGRPAVWAAVGHWGQ